MSAAQVRQAYVQVREVYAEEGADGLVRFSRNCHATLASDARLLDFCIAFDIYAAPVAGTDPIAGAWFAAASQRAAAATAATLPSAEAAAARLVAVRQQARLVIPQSRAPAAARTAQRAAAASGKPARLHVQARARATQVRPKRVTARAAVKPAGDCRLRSTPIQRALCGSATLRTAERRMQTAYSRALTSGANRRRLAADQARFRLALTSASGDREAATELYAQRTRELRAMASARGR